MKKIKEYYSELSGMFGAKYVGEINVGGLIIGTIGLPFVLIGMVFYYTLSFTITK